LKRVVGRAATQAAETEWAWIENQNAQALQEMLNEGMELTEPADDEKEWMEKARTIWPRFYDKIGGKEIVDKVLQVIEER